MISKYIKIILIIISLLGCETKVKEKPIIHKHHSKLTKADAG